MKYFGVITFGIVAALCIVTSNAVSSSYGHFGPYEKIIYQQYIIKKASWFWSVKKDVKFPPEGYVNNRIITGVRAIDQTGGKNTTTGYASMSDGGPGFKHVLIHLKSPRGHGLNFTIVIYAGY